jgi:hypothetical protein
VVAQEKGKIMTPVEFEGDAPFALPVAQGAVAVERDGIVAMTLYLSVPGHGPMPVAVHVDMLRDTAAHLGDLLIQAAADAAKASK